MSEGDTLYLSCDGSNSDPLPTLHWVSPDGETVNDTGQLVIMDITRNMSGLYSCVATLPNSTMTMNTTVSVTFNEGKNLCSRQTYITQAPSLTETSTLVAFIMQLLIFQVLYLICLMGG